MRFLGKLIVGLLIVAGVLAAAAFALPRQVEVTRSIVVNAPASQVFPYVNDLRKFNDWSPWATIDPKTTYQYEGPDQGAGQKVTWSSEHRRVGKGSQEIVSSVPDQRVDTALDFGEMGTAKAAFRLTPDGTGTRVDWNFETDTGNNPMARWMGLMFDRWIGSEYEKGLSKLKTVVEQT